jgi:hypothetical protein
MKRMKDYHDLYLETDVLLLADIFESFRKTCLGNYGLDPAHYLSAPGLSWDAFLKRSGSEIELVSDMDMFQFFEKGMRGGTSYIAHRYSKANNKHMSTHDEEMENNYLMYLDANNLYGWAMSQPLPNGGFEWVEDTSKINIDDYLGDEGRGMVLEVDMEYPEELHNSHNGYPLAPESREIKKEMLSEYAREIAEKYNVSVGGIRKLVTSLGSREKYVVHVRNLKLYTDLGMKLTKIHRAVTFNQSKWLSDYIAYNTKMRSVSKNTFEKNFFKLMNNSIYGKTMENVRKRVDVKLVSTKEDLVKVVASPCFQSQRIMNENLVAVKRIKEVLTLSKPCYVGMCILDLSKTLMYDFHYNTIKKEYRDKARLLFTDTDSLMYEIKTDDVYEDFKRIGEEEDCWDNSDYPKDNPYYSDHNKKVIGKFKDEAAGVPIVEFVGLRSKMYSYVKENGKGGMTAKGVKKYVIKNKLTHDHFKGVIREKEQLRHNMNTMRSVKHQIGTYEMRKVTLSCFDDKRHLLDDGVTSYAYGNKNITTKIPYVHTVIEPKFETVTETDETPTLEKCEVWTDEFEPDEDTTFEEHDPPKFETVTETSELTNTGKCEVWTNEYEPEEEIEEPDEPDRAWLTDHSKYIKKPYRSPSLVEQHQELMAFIRQEENYSRLLLDEVCEACDDENQPDSTDEDDDEPLVEIGEMLHNNITGRTWAVTPVEGRRKRKSRIIAR